MSRKQFFRLTLILTIPFIIIGALLTVSTKINPRNIAINCYFETSFCSSSINSDRVFLDYDEVLNTIEYYPSRYTGPEVFLREAESLIYKKVNSYDLREYKSSIELQEASDNNEDGVVISLRNPILDIKDLYLSPCRFSRYNDTNLFYLQGQNTPYSVCRGGNLYFKLSETDSMKMREIDSLSMKYYTNMRTVVVVKSIVIFLSPFIIYLTLVFLVLLFIRCKNFVISGHFRS